MGAALALAFSSRIESHDEGGATLDFRRASQADACDAIVDVPTHYQGQSSSGSRE